MSKLDDVIHEIYIWPKEFFEYAEELKKRTDTDIVALVQGAQGAYKAVVQIRLLGVLGKAYVKVVQGKHYIVFKGPPGLRPNLLGTRYLRANPKVAMFVVGTREIIKDTAEGFKVAVIAYVALDVMQEILQDHFSLARLGVKVASDISQALISAGVGAVAGVVATTLGAPVVVAFVIVVAVGFVAGMYLTHLDQKYHLTDKAVERMMELEREAKAGLAELGGRIEDRIDDEIRRGVNAAISTAGRYAADRLQRLIDDFLRDHLYPYRMR
jgi:hypothetical protein